MFGIAIFAYFSMPSETKTMKILKDTQKKTARDLVTTSPAKKRVAALLLNSTPTQHV